MGYQPRIKSSRGTMKEYRRPLYEKNKKRLRRRAAKSKEVETQPITETELSQATLKRLSILGNQRFGSSPYSEHFDRWLTNIEAVLVEFEGYPNMNIDGQFVSERSKTLTAIKLQLELRRRREATIDQELKNLAITKSHLEQINTDYLSKLRVFKSRKNNQILGLYRAIDELKKEQNRIIRLKTGFLRGISNKTREQKELEVVQQLTGKQSELELRILDFNAEQKAIRSEYEQKREPMLLEIKQLKKNIQNIETDGSLEERWFACQALIEAVNTFLQRKALKPQNP